MENLQINEAKANFSALVAAAEKGRPTLVSRRGLACAKIVPVTVGARLYPLDAPNLANYLLGIPESFAVERGTTQLRGVSFK